MIDLEGVGVRQHAGDAGQRSLVDRGGRIEFGGGQRRRRPGQRRRGEQALQPVEARVDIIAQGIADRDFAGEQPREFERRAGLGVAAGGIARKAGAVELHVVCAAVALELGERFHAGQEIVAEPADAAILVEVAVVIGRRGAVGELAVGIDGAIDSAAGRKLQAIENLVDAEGAAERRKDRIPRKPSLNIRAAGIVGGDAQAQLRGKTGVAGDVETAVDMAGEIRPVETGRR